MKIIDQLRQITGDRYVNAGPDFGGYSRDWAEVDRWTPLAVVRPGSTEEVSAILRATYAEGVPVTPVSGNTGVSGGTAAQGAVMVSLDRLNQIEPVNEKARSLRVAAGATVANIHAAAEDKGLIFPLKFGAQGSAQIGGALSTNAGGANVLRYGNARALCLGVEVVLPDGRITNLMSALHKDNSGYDLRDLFIGAEGTLGIITGAVLKLFPKPQSEVNAMIACPNLDAALTVLRRLQAVSGNSVEAFEYMPDVFIQAHMDHFHGAREPFAQRYPINILAQITAQSQVDAHVSETGEIPVQNLVEQTLADLMESGEVADAVLAKNETEAQEMWTRRDTAAELALNSGPYFSADAALPLDQIGPFLDRAETAFKSLDPDATAIWVGHLGDGNLHYTVHVTRDDKAHKTAISEAIEDVIEQLGGSFSAEHGVGTHKLGSMARQKDPIALDVMRAIKNAIDPKGLMNPGKVIPEI